MYNQRILLVRFVVSLKLYNSQLKLSILSGFLSKHTNINKWVYTMFIFKDIEHSMI